VRSEFGTTSSAVAGGSVASASVRNAIQSSSRSRGDLQMGAKFSGDVHRERANDLRPRHSDQSHVPRIENRRFEQSRTFQRPAVRTGGERISPFFGCQIRHRPHIDQVRFSIVLCPCAISEAQGCLIVRPRSTSSVCWDILVVLAAVPREQTSVAQRSLSDSAEIENRVPPAPAFIFRRSVRSCVRPTDAGWLRQRVLFRRRR
jgi:hypothetical protein